MDSYGVVPIWDHLLSVPGLIVYLLVAAVLVFLSWRLSDNYLRLFNFFIMAITVLVFWTYVLAESGMWFYVKA
jgi:uncharacterized protein YjeT (DUF2065 family)